MQLGRYCVRQQGVNSNAMTNIYMEPGKPAVSPAGSRFRPEEVNDMTFKRGDTCFILEDNSQAVQVKVVSKQGGHPKEVDAQVDGGQVDDVGGGGHPL